MDLIRLILLELAERRYTVGWHDISIDGYEPSEISYHVKLLHDAGFIEADSITHGASQFPEWKPISITWDGQEFLESAREKTRWENAKQVIRYKGSAMTLEALKLVLSELIKKGLTGKT